MSNKTLEPVQQLERKLGLWQVTLSGVGVIIGAGVYALIGPAAGKSGGAIWLSFLLAASIAAVTGYSYARFSAIRPKNSPEFQYISISLGNRIGFIGGWIMLLADLISAATVTLGFAGYLNHVSPIPTMWGAILLLSILSIIAFSGITQSVAVVIIFTILEIAGLVFIILIGLPDWGSIDYLEMPEGFSGIWSAAALVFFAYLGFDELGNLAEETRKPEKVLPLALFIAILISSVIYIAVSISTVSVLGWEELSRSSAPLAEVAGEELGSRADTVLSYLALAATANTVLLLLIAASRSMHGMSSAGMLPGWLSKIGFRKIPWVATGISVAAAVGFTLVGDLESVAEMTNAIVLFAFALVNLSFLIWSLKNLKKLSRLVNSLLPMVGIVTCLWLVQYTGLNAIGFAALVSLSGVLISVKPWALRTGTHKSRVT